MKDLGLDNTSDWNFLSKFAKLYRENKHFSSGLLVGMVKAVITRADGHINAKVSENVIGLCQVLHAKSPVGYKLMKENLFGISIRRIQRIQAKERGACVLDQLSIKDRVGKWTSSLSETIGRKPFIHLAVDATKTPKIEEISAGFGVMVGGAAPKHLLTIDKDRTPLKKQELADETKVAILTTQDAASGISVMKIISARPQTTNQKCDEYNQLLVDTVMEDENCILGSICFDGLSAESDFIRNGLISFMVGKTDVTYGTDMNHLAKSIRSAVVLGTNVLKAGHALVDTGLLLLIGIKKDLVQITDYTSDGLVTELCSKKTLESLAQHLDEEEGDHMAALGLTLYFIRIAIIAVNSKEEIKASERICMLWSSLIWISSIHGFSNITMNNFSTAILSNIFLCAQERVKAPRLTTTETIEHTFGNIRQRKREFTIKKLMEYVDKMELAFRNMTTHNIMGANTTKGYMYGFNSYRDQVSKMVHANESSSKSSTAVNLLGGRPGVEVNYESSVPVAEQIQDFVLEYINSVSSAMVPFMKRFGFKNFPCRCNQFNSFETLASAYLSTMPSTFIESTRNSLPAFNNPFDRSTEDKGESSAEDEVESGSVTDEAMQKADDILFGILQNFTDNLSGNEKPDTDGDDVLPPLANVPGFFGNI